MSLSAIKIEVKESSKSSFEISSNELSEWLHDFCAYSNSEGMSGFLSIKDSDIEMIEESIEDGELILSEDDKETLISIKNDIKNSGIGCVDYILY